MTNKRTGIYKKTSIKRKMLSLRGRKAARVEATPEIEIGATTTISSNS